MSQNNESLISRDFKGIWISREMWFNKELTIHEKILWLEIDSLYDEEKGGCWASEEYLQEFMDLKRSRLHEIYKSLTDKGYLIRIGCDGRSTIRKAILPNKIQNNGRKASGKPESNPGSRTEIVREAGSDPLKPHIYSENKDKNKDIAQPAAQLRQKVLDICFTNGKFHGITSEDKEKWKSLYPASDVELQIKHMEEWCISNPAKAKSKKLWRKFIINWLRRNNEEIINKQSYKSQKNTDRRVLEKDGSYSKHQAEDLF